MKKLSLLLILIPILLCGCNNKETNKIMMCTKEEPFQGTQIEWINNIKIEYNKHSIIKALIEHNINPDSNITLENKKSFKESIVNMCDTMGVDFDSCKLIEKNNGYIVRLSTNNLDILDNAVSSYDSQNIVAGINIEELKDILEEKEYVCTLE